MVAAFAFAIVVVVAAAAFACIDCGDSAATSDVLSFVLH